ncbi:type II CAAX prenyl endopeptidase Rce1 family protein [Halalkalibacter sp. AB-rgal2]|uniref:CPBP family glutamic-type intramembrane protease n=1 Tax=Halalkalibacter sp. AB-rgal2 TaxID=3242695 RepID=UPI00359EFF95
MKRSKFDSRLIIFFCMITLGGFTISHIESISGRYEVMEVRALLMSITLVLILLFLKMKSNKVEEWSLFYRGRLTIVVSSITLGFFAWLLPTIVVIGGSIALGWATIEMEVSITEILFQALPILPLMLLAYILPEEWAFRGYIYRILVKRRSMWVSIFIQALLFAVWGLLANGQLDGFIAFLGFGLFLGLLCHMTNTIWLGVGLRLAAATVPLLLHTINYEIIYMEGLLNFLLGILTIVVAYLIMINVKRQQPNEVLNNLKKEHPNIGSENSKNLAQRGIIYDVGSSYAPGQSSKEIWKSEAVKDDLQIIRESLHCNAITIMGDNLERLEEATHYALEHDLFVWLHPTSFGSNPQEMLLQLKNGAILAEKIREKHPDKIGLKVGLELSVFTSGSIPGKDFGQRAQNLKGFGLLLPLFNRRLNALLKQAVAVTRDHYRGGIIYGAGSWEEVNWDLFDFIGVNYYLDSSTATNYVEGLRRYQQFNKPIIITEFGCCAYKGAELRGGEGGWIQDWSNLSERKLDGEYMRDEQVQANYIGQLIEVFETENVYGAFINQFIEEDHPYSDEALYDLDMASLGIVKACPQTTNERGWIAKKAFYEIANRYSQYKSSQ